MTRYSTNCETTDNCVPKLIFSVTRRACDFVRNEASQFAFQSNASFWRHKYRSAFSYILIEMIILIELIINRLIGKLCRVSRGSEKTLLHKFCTNFVPLLFHNSVRFYKFQNTPIENPKSKEN